MKVTPFALVLAMLAGSHPASAAAHSDFTSAVPWQTLRTFRFKEQARIPEDPLTRSDTWSNDLETAIRDNLRAHGRTEAAGGAPDFYVAYSVGLKHRSYNDFDAVIYGLPVYQPDIRGGWAGWPAAYDTSTVPYTESTVTIDITDAHTHRLLWRGHASDTLNPRKPDKALSSAVDHVLSKFYHDANKQGT